MYSYLWDTILEARHLPSKCDIFTRHECAIFDRR